MKESIMQILRALFLGGIILDGIFILVTPIWTLPFGIGVLLLVILIALVESTTSIIQDLRDEF